MHVLVVSDHPLSTTRLMTALRRRGLTVEQVRRSDHSEASATVTCQRPRVVVFDSGDHPICENALRFIAQAARSGSEVLVLADSALDLRTVARLAIAGTSAAVPKSKPHTALQSVVRTLAKVDCREPAGEARDRPAN